MRFIVDASADIRLVPHLTLLGHDATFVGIDYPGELSDIEIAEIALSEDRIVIADDRHFGDLAIRHRVPLPGVIYFRVSGQDIVIRLALLDAVLERFPDPTGLLVVASPNQMRSRRLDRS